MSIDNPYTLSGFKRLVDKESRRVNRWILIQRIVDFIFLCIGTFGWVTCMFCQADVGIGFWARFFIGIGYGLCYGAAICSWIRNITKGGI